jgi:hypothetical protein
MEGGTMFCVYPSDGSEGQTYPFISFEHGDLGGGATLQIGYKSFLETVASAGFVICAPTQCPYSCRPTQHTHQLHAIDAGKELAAKGTLPIRLDGLVGVAGHSTGGMTTLRCSYAENVEHYGIGAAFMYNGDGGSEIEGDNITFDAISPELPMFLVTGTKDIIEPKGSTKDNQDRILATNPKQPLLTAMIDGEGHLDPNDVPIVHPAPLRSVPYFIAFFGRELLPSSECLAEYEDALGPQLQAVSPSLYFNQLFGQSGMLV